MGGIFSGTTGFRGGKPPVDALPRIVCGNRGPAARALATPYLYIEQPDLAVVVFGPMKWYIHLATTTPNFGGSRRLFLCPRCSSRRVSLYIAESTLACRTCLGLRYASQHETERDRSMRRAHKLRDRLGWGGGILDEEGGRPRGGHKKTYARLTTELANLTAALLGDLEKWLGRAEATLGHSVSGAEDQRGEGGGTPVSSRAISRRR
jgi:hypothetical protein